MNKLKYLAGSAIASLALILGLAMPVGASENYQPRTPTTDNSVDNSCDDSSCNPETTTITKTYNCSIVNSDLNNDSEVEAEDNDDDNVITGTSTIGGVQLTCTTNNVTNVTNAAPQVLAATTTAQVVAPTGGVKAGAGGTSSNVVTQVFGMVSSFGVLAAGFAVRKFAL